MSINGIGGSTGVQASNVASVQAKIQSSIESLEGMSLDLQGLIAQLQAEAQAKPEAPNTSGMKPDAAKKANDDFQAKLAAWQGRIATLQQSIKDKIGDINDKQRDLATLQGSELPAAQAKDLDNANKAAENAKKAGETAVKTASESIDDRTDSRREEVQAERRAQERATRGVPTPARGLPGGR